MSSNNQMTAEEALRQISEITNRINMSETFRLNGVTKVLVEYNKKTRDVESPVRVNIEIKPDTSEIELHWYRDKDGRQALCGLPENPMEIFITHKKGSVNCPKCLDLIATPIEHPDEAYKVPEDFNEKIAKTQKTVEYPIITDEYGSLMMQIEPSPWMAALGVGDCGGRTCVGFKFDKWHVIEDYPTMRWPDGTCKQATHAVFAKVSDID